MSDETTSGQSSEGEGAAGIAAQILNAIASGNGDTSGAHKLSVEDLLRHTRDQLLGFARRLGVAGVSKLSKSELAARLRGLLARHARGGTHGGPGKPAMTATPAAMKANAPGRARQPPTRCR